MARPEKSAGNRRVVLDYRHRHHHRRRSRRVLGRLRHRVGRHHRRRGHHRLRGRGLYHPMQNENSDAFFWSLSDSEAETK